MQDNKGNVIDESILKMAKTKLGGFQKRPNASIGKKAEFFYVEDLGNQGYVKPDMHNPIFLDYLHYCPDFAFAKKLKDRYMQVYKLPPDYPINVIKRTKEIVG